MAQNNDETVPVSRALKLMIANARNRFGRTLNDIDVAIPRDKFQAVCEEMGIHPAEDSVTILTANGKTKVSCKAAPNG